MESEDYQVGDLVWAKMRRYPIWPARIAAPTTNVQPPKNKAAHFVYFFGSEDYAWIFDKNLTPHSEGIFKTLKVKSGPYQKAIDAFINYSKSRSKGKRSFTKSENEKVQNEEEDSQAKVVNSVARKHDMKVSTVKPPLKTLKRSFDNIDSGDSAHSPSKSGNSSVDTKVNMLMNSILTLYNNNQTSLSRENEVHEERRFGFIGLGPMGRAILRNMIESGCHMTVWNRSAAKLHAFIELGAKIALSPADLVVKCDVIISCVSDSDATRALIFGEQGILNGLEKAKILGQGPKGYVEMTSIDPNSSVANSEAIMKKRGLYLEAPLCGTITDAEEGTLLTVVSGDRRLFHQCESCFQAISKHIFFLTCEIGFSFKVTLIVKMLSGTVCAALAEALVLAERLDIANDDFLDLLCFGPLNNSDLLKKMEWIRSDDFPNVTIQHMQKDIHKSLRLADLYSQPMPVTAAANEALKLAKNLKRCGTL